MKNFNFKKGILLFIFLIGIFLLPAIGVEAADDKTFDFIPQVGIPGSDFEKGKTAEMEKGTTKPIAVYIKAIYTWAIGFIGVLAAVVLMIGGVIWLTAGGNNNKVETAKQWIGGALTGLVLALGSYMLLYQINPDLVDFKVANIKTADFEGEEEKKETGPGCCQFYLGNQSNYECKEVKGGMEECKEKEPEYYTTLFFSSTKSCIGGSRCQAIDEKAECNGGNVGETCNSCGEAPCHCVEAGTDNFTCTTCKVAGENCVKTNYEKQCCGNMICEHSVGWGGGQWKCVYP